MKYNSIVTIAIITFQSKNIINNCISSIPKNYKVLIIENSNSKILKKKLEDKFNNVYCYLNKNNGFGQAANIAIKKIKTKYIFFINPDVTLKKNTIKVLINTAKSFKDKFSILLPSEKREYSNKIREIKEIGASSMFVNKKEIIKINGFDENFFLYYEDTDLSIRLSKINSKIYLVPFAKVCHLGGKSHDNNYNFEIELSRGWHLMWSLFYFKKKHYGKTHAYISTILLFFRYLFKYILLILISKNKSRKYKFRFMGLLNAYLNKPSWYRPKC
jgi:GT2 family glycosyltransferase